MHFSFSTIAAAALALATLGDCHLIMKTPVPFGVSTLNNSPLNDAKPGASGSDYPCKQRPGVYDLTKMNHIAVDTPTEMSFIGSASHGGGTCQIAMSKDKEPTANSTFKIIQVFEGGCPIDSDGNGGTHPFSFTIPKEFPNGVFTLTWLWYNRIGNREAYMNCAPVTVTGGSSSGDDYFNSLPNMYIINLPTQECESTYQSMSNAVTIPHPGQFIMTETNGQDMHAATGSGCAAAAAAQLEGVVGYKSNVITNNGAAYKAPGGAAAAPSGGASAAPSGGASAAPSSPSYGGSAAGGSSAAAGGSSAAAGASSAAAGGSSAAAGPSSAAASGMVTISTPAAGAPSGAPSSAAAGSVPAGSAPAGSAPAASGAPSSAAAAPSSAAASGYGGAAPSSAAAAAPSGAAPSGQACSSSGMSCSSDGKKFGLCANGAIVWQAVAAGTSCKNGSIVKRSEFRNAHVRRHALNDHHA